MFVVPKLQCVTSSHTRRPPPPTPTRSLSRSNESPSPLARAPPHVCTTTPTQRSYSSGRQPHPLVPRSPFPIPVMPRPAHSCPLGPAATLPPALPSACTCPAPPTGSSPMHAGASSMCPEWIMNLSPVCRRARQALPGRKPHFPAGVAFKDRPLCRLSEEPAEKEGGLKFNPIDPPRGNKS